MHTRNCESSSLKKAHQQYMHRTPLLAILFPSLSSFFYQPSVIVLSLSSLFGWWTLVTIDVIANVTRPAVMYRKDPPLHRPVAVAYLSLGFFFHDAIILIGLAFVTITLMCIRGDICIDKASVCRWCTYTWEEQFILRRTARERKINIIVAGDMPPD